MNIATGNLLLLPCSSFDDDMNSPTTSYSTTSLTLHPSSSVDSYEQADPTKVSLHISGVHFAVEQQIFCHLQRRVPLSPRNAGDYILRTTPTAFEVVLEYMRQGKLPDDLSSWRKVDLEELEPLVAVLELTELSTVVHRALLRGRHRETAQKQPRRRWMRGGGDGKVKKTRKVQVTVPLDGSTYNVDTVPPTTTKRQQKGRRKSWFRKHPASLTAEDRKVLD